MFMNESSVKECVLNLKIKKTMRVTIESRKEYSKKNRQVNEIKSNPYRVNFNFLYAIVTAIHRYFVGIL